MSAFAIVSIVVGASDRGRAATRFSSLPREVRSPAENPSTPEKIALGRLLFWDPILSGDRDVACATCHHPNNGYTDNRDLPVGTHGIGLGPARRFTAGNQLPFARRNSLTLLNAAFNGMDPSGTYDPQAAPMFWDMRVASLEAQALEPMRALEEMRGDRYAKDDIISVVVGRLDAVPDYRAAFAHVFGGANAVTAVNMARALASFERTLVASNAPFDRYMRGDTSAMSAAQISGMAQFERSGCANCHTGPMFSDYKLHVLGVPDSVRLTAPDTGANSTYAFRTPTLRNLAYTAPYTHSGVFPTLDAVVNFYNVISGGRGGGRPGGPGGGRPAGPPGGPGRFPPPQGGRGPGGPGRGGRGPQPNVEVRRDQLDPLLQQVNVRDGRADLLQFLDALNDPSFDRTIPDRVPSGLPPGGAIH
jgi:cytochrome c peroxidase